MMIRRLFEQGYLKVSQLSQDPARIELFIRELKNKWDTLSLREFYYHRAACCPVDATSARPTDNKA